jgi:outer membrane protein assembly factor BamB
VGSDDDKLYALNPDDGTEQWAYETGGPVQSSPAVDSDGTIYVGSDDNKLHAVNPDGTGKWTYETGDTVRSSPVVGSDGTVYVGSDDSRVYAINPDGSLKWEFLTGGPISTSLVIAPDGTIYVGSTDGKLYALDSANGSEKSGWPFVTGGTINSNPVIGTAVIYVGSADGKFYAINPDGSLKWAVTIGENISSYPVIGPDGIIYLGCEDNKIYAINPADGTEKWSFETGGPINSAPVIGEDGLIYVGSTDNKLYAVDSEDGGREWAFATDGDISSSPVLDSDGNLYVGSNDSRIYNIPSDSSQVFTGLEAEPGKSWVQLKWNRVSDATSYRIYYQDSEGVNNSSAYTTISLPEAVSGSVTGLENGITWYFRVEARNADDPFLLSSEISATPLDTLSDLFAPSITEIIAGGNDALIRWSIVDDAVSYRIYYSDVSGVTYSDSYVSVAGGASSSGTVSGFVKGTRYYFRVSAIDASDGKSLSSEVSAWTIPETPIGVSVTGLTEEIEVNWVAVTGANSYNIYYKDGVGVDSSDAKVTVSGGTSSSGKISWLNSGAHYYVRVEAVNDSGGSPLSAEADAWTIPAAPADVIAVAHVGEAELSWTAVTGADSYNIYYKDSSGVSKSDSKKNISGGGSSSGTVGGLADGVTYYFCIEAVNASGGSALSVEVEAITVPGVPTGLIASGGLLSVELNWNEMAGATKYKQRYREVGATEWTENAWGAAKPVTILALSAGTEYDFSVKSGNDSGESDWSSSVSEITVPAIPTGLIATGGSLKVDLSWDEMTGADEYRFSWRAVGGLWAYSEWASGLTRSFTGLSAGTVYEFQIQSRNSSGESALSATVSEITLPAAPTNVSATGGSLKVTVNWTAVTGSTGYRIYYKEGSGVSASDSFVEVSGGESSSGEVTGLDAGIHYYFRVEAINNSGPGSLSSEVDAWTIPPTPTGLIATGGSLSVSLNWSATTGATEYSQRHKKSGATEWTENIWSSARPRTISGLDAGTEYDFAVKAQNSSGESDWSAPVSEITKPAAPTGVSATGGTLSVTVNWTAVTGATEYRIYYKTSSGVTTANSYVTVSGGASTSRVVSSLTAGTRYYFRVEARNDSGASALSLEVNAWTRPGTPTNVSATGGSLSFTANWTAVTGTTAYRIYYKTSPGVTTSDTSKYISGGATTSGVVTSLSAGTLYYLRVRAYNSAGWSSLSSEVSARTVPATPVGLAATGSTQQVALSWTATTGADDYRFYWRISGGTWAYSTWATGTSRTFTGLSDGRTYEFQIQSRNVSGSSELSSTVSAITIPGAPTGVSATGGSLKVAVNWTAVTGATEYRIYYKTSTGVSTADPYVTVAGGTSTSGEVGSLSAGTRYYLKVEARNGSGADFLSSEVDAWTLPAAPTGVSATGGSLKVTVNWTAVTGATEYRIYYKTSTGVTTADPYVTVSGGASISGEVASLSAGTRYYFKVEARNGSGASALSSEVNAWTIPATPVGLAATGGTQQIALSWTATTGADDYRFYWRISGGTWAYSTWATGTSRTFTGLLDGRTYEFRIQSRNVSGSSSLSATVSKITKPAAPTDVSATGGSLKVTVNWTAVTGATEYRIYYKTSTGVTTANSYVTVSGGTSTSGEVASLSAGTRYYFKVEARNGSGSSALSSEVNAWTLPAAPTGVSATGGSLKVTVNWTAVTGATEYRIYYKTSTGVTTANSYVTVSGGASISGEVASLSAGTRYYFKVEARNGSGASALSSEVNAWTIPATPVGLAATGGTQQIALSWTATTGADDYRFYWRISGGTWAYSTWATGTSRTFTGLSDGRTYEFRIQSRNVSGSSSLSATVSKITKPAAPTGVSATGGSLKVAVNWTAVTGATEYRIYYKTSTGVTTANSYVTVSGGTSTSGEVASLSASTRYYFKVEARNGSGASALSSEVNAWTVPPAPTLDVFAGYKQYFLDYSATGATEYQVLTQYLNGGSWTSWITAKPWSADTSFKRTTSGYRYRFKVQARNSAGISPDSDVVERMCTTTISTKTILAGSTAGITIDKDFDLGTYEVTQLLWEQVMGPGNWPGTAPSAAYGRGDDYPMYYVSWEDINKKGGFLDALNERDGRNLSVLDEATETRYDPAKVPANYWCLPTADEHEYAHRAGTETYHYWGDGEALADIDPYAWYSGNSGSKVHPVGGKLPNDWDLYDMSGNLVELMDKRSTNCLVLGGDYSRSAWYMRSSYRSWAMASYSSTTYIGFRLLKVRINP